MERYPRVVLVTDPAFSDERILNVTEQCARALPKGALVVHLRDKGRPRADVLRLAKALRTVTHGTDSRLLVHRDIALAIEAAADGVHLGSDGLSIAEARREFHAHGKTGWISIAAHTDDDIVRARDEGADSALVSPIFETSPPRPGFESGVSGSVAKPARGVEAIRRARAIAGRAFPLYALGGITETNASECVLAGATGVAVLRALLAAEDCVSVARAIHDATLHPC